ncbi:MAG: single-stranded DNA-binding protein [Solirubrobacteraceae bacterium]
MSYASTNRVVLIGNLTRDPELRELPSGNRVCNLRIACNGIRRDAEGEYRERPLYFDVAAFGGLAESVARYMHKGSLLAVDGRLEWSEWETSDRSEETLASGEHPRSGQQKRQAVSVVAENIQFLDRPAARGEGGRAQGEDGTESDERELVGAGAGSEIDLVF